MLLGGQFNLARLLSYALVMLIAMTIHEYAHNYVADKMGDPTPRQMKRLTLNPMVHIDWFGWLMWVVVGFGTLGYAIINPRYMRNQRWGYLLAVAAGPFSNLLLAAFAAILFRMGIWRFDYFGARDIIPNFNQIMTVWFSLNLLLFLFNLIPLYPLDGWKVLLMLLPPRESAQVARYERESYFVLIGLILLTLIGVGVLGWVINPPFNFLTRVLLGF